MATVIGEDPKVYKRFTCMECAAIVEYAPKEEQWNGQTDEGCKIFGLNCPRCGAWYRTNS